MKTDDKTWVPLGVLTANAYGFPRLEFEDAYDNPCSIQTSSAVGDYEDSLERPGTSFLWIGIDDADPQVMARDAASLGIETNETTGWVPYPVPEEVLLKTRMHLDRDQVRGLIARLQEWLDNGVWNEIYLTEE